MKYLVIELQTSTTGELGNFVFAFDAQAEAESKYHAVLSAAAISTVAEHAAVLMTSKGYVLDTKCYTHGETVTA